MCPIQMIQVHLPQQQELGGGGGGGGGVFSSHRHAKMVPMVSILFLHQQKFGCSAAGCTSISMAASDGSTAVVQVGQDDSATTKVADLLRFWNPEFLQHQLEHASVMDELPAVKVR